MFTSWMLFFFYPQTLLSLSKLALLASSEEEKEEKVRQLNDQLHHIAVQQSLPVEILEVRMGVLVLR